LKTRLQEIELTVANGANEIDVVIDRSLVLTGNWDALYSELQQMKKACGAAHLKVILGVGELGTYDNVSESTPVYRRLSHPWLKENNLDSSVLFFLLCFYFFILFLFYGTLSHRLDLGKGIFTYKCYSKTII
jgi:hypothetical protein